MRPKPTPIDFAATSRSVSERLTGYEARVDTTIGEGDEMYRGDLDDYEASLKRRRWIVSIGAAVFVLALAAVVPWWLVLRPAPLHTRRFVWAPALAGLALMVVSLTSISVKRDTASEIFAARQLTVPSQAPPKPKFDTPPVQVGGAVSPAHRTDLTVSRTQPADPALAAVPSASIQSTAR